MPPKRRVLTDDEQKTQFEDWKNSDEYKCLEEVRQRFQDLELPISFSETTKDITGNWVPVLDKLFELFQMNKVKNPKIKKFEHEHFRTIFFSKFDDDGVVNYVDGIKSGVGKVAGQRADNMRRSFIGIYKKVNDLQEWDYTSYLQMKKDLLALMKDFMKPTFFPLHVKSKEGHGEILEKLLDVLTPLRLLIEKNMDYRLFNLKYQSFLEREVQGFKLREIEKKYTDYLQEVLRIIVKEYVQEDPKNPVPGPMNFMPRVEQLFYQIHYKFSDKNEIEFFYLSRLHEKFIDMQKELCTLEYKGWLYWKTPLIKNEKLIKTIKDVMNAEVICKSLMGTELLREQINFVFRVMKHLRDSDRKIAENMDKEDENAVAKATPLLMIFQALQDMRKWKDTKLAEEKQLQIEREKMGLLSQMKEGASPGVIQETKSPHKILELKTMNSTLSPLKTQNTLISTISPDKKAMTGTGSMSMVEKNMSTTKFFQEGNFRIPGKELDAEEVKYGRYFILENYIDNEHRQRMEEAVEHLRHLNKAVQQDIEDYYIREGITPMKKKGTDIKELKEAIKYLDERNLEENSNEREKMVRPPQLWNYPKIIEETHQFRTIADPKQCYIDGRFEAFNQIVEDCAQNLLVFNTVPWNRMVQRIIDCFRNHYREEPETELILEEIKNF